MPQTAARTVNLGLLYTLALSVRGNENEIITADVFQATQY